MHIRFSRLGNVAIMGAVITLASVPMQAGQIPSESLNPESTLLGIRLLKSTYRDVMQKYGQPDEIQAGGPFAPTPPAYAANQTASGGMGAGMMGGPRGMMPGGPGMGGSGGKMGGLPMAAGGAGGGGGARMGGAPGGGNGGRVPSRTGFPGSTGGGGAGGGGRMGPGMPGSGGPGMAPGGPGMMPGGAGMPGSGGMMGGGGLPGFGNSPEEGGDETGGMPGMTPGAGGTTAEGNPPLRETTWWYHLHGVKGEGGHFAFVFNKKGEVIQIGEYGPRPLYKMSSKTRQGIDLGAIMGQVIARYGWSFDGAHDGENVILRYSGSNQYLSAKIAFQVVKNRVLGITIGAAR